jgi:hypothetical protein
MVKQQAQVLAGATIGFLVMMGVLSYSLLASGETLTAPPWVLVGAQLVAGLVVHLVCESVGYRVPAVPPGTPEAEGTRLGVAAYQSRALLRIALSEAIAVASLAGAFVVGGGGAWPLYLVGAGVSVVLLAVHGWPWSRPVDRIETALERDGARVGLREAFGLRPRLTGAVREL